MKLNGCIFLISARKNLLKICLTLLERNYNHRFNYPIHIFYHGNKYDDINFRKSIQEINPKTEYHFHKILAILPQHIQEKDLFYNKIYNEYVKTSFSKERLGYLFAITWKINSIEDDILKKYEYFIMIDDDSWFKNPITKDLFVELNENNKLLGTAYTWNNVNSRVLDTREQLFEYTKNYINKYLNPQKNINDNNTNDTNKIKSRNLREIMLKSEKYDPIHNRTYNKEFHEQKFLSGNCNIYNRKLFETKEWKQYLKEFNDFGGGYKYRWGDCEIISLFYYIHIGDEFYDFKLKDKGLYHNQIKNKWDCIFDKECL